MGSPDFAVPTLDALVEAGHDVVAVYTQPPRPAGRGKAERPTAVDDRAGELGIEVRCPKSLRSEVEQEAFAELDADVAVVAAYGLILPQPILDAPMFGCLNVHGSLLPRWRGAAPVQRAIMAGDEVTGVTIMQMEAGLDTGPMLLKRAVEIDDKNAAQLTEELAKLGAAMMVEVLADLPSFEPIPQPEDGVTYAAKIKKEEARIDWARPARELARHVQGLAPFPGAWFEVNGERIKLLAAMVEPLTRHPREGGDPAEENPGSRFRGNDGLVLDDRLLIQCGAGALRPMLLQRAGRAPMSADELLRGYSIPPGTRLE
jgi:methionyl-tRNA formyltransferase